MRIEIHTGKFSLTDSLRAYIERRAQFGFSWAQQSLHTISLRLDDLNGPKGGVDKRCRVQIPIVGGSSVVIEEVQADLYVAIDRAIERAGRSLTRKLERKRKHAHKRFEPVFEDENHLAVS